MSAINHITTARNDEFSSRVLMLSFTAAQNVASEDPGTADHAARVAYAGHVLIGGENAKILATHVISSNPTIQSTIDSAPDQLGKNVPDGDIAFALSSIWTARSLAFQAAQ
jgi:hypothetical protein